MLARHFTIICICAFAFAILFSALVESAKQNRRGPTPISFQYDPQY
ncbi:hypothetical protein ACFWXH_26050 [Mesorhizobium sp. NPDC059054]